MVKVEFTSFDGNTVVAEGRPGQSVLQVAIQNGVMGISGECGGVLSCATCHVFVSDDDLSKVEPMSDAEDAMLDGTAIDRTANSRLACQLKFINGLDSLRVSTPEYQE
ncbi:2Fe-2S ferredoxin [Pseudomonas sp. JAI111]|uniref:(2Fe-2S)-binding protein n=1 Tax=Pseudomonas sp. JAI111 TaxID=2735913 RepID=UPI002166F771|nr:(2Fe-2S)-binding protein [Pseudomonas sp. JAI111]MCS3835670.1 2Fe-2S ferredoxin [Pseudomonas sp. JAI111]